MSFSVGIVGLPNVGKSTLFQALTKKRVDIASHPFTTIHPNLGIVAVPDERLERIAQIIKPEKVTRTTIEFIDIAGLVKGAHKGEGLGNQFLSHVRNCDAILEVVRSFSASAEGYGGEDGKLQYQLWEPPNPQRDMEIIKIELLMKDFETVESLFLKSEKESKKDKKAQKRLETLKKIKEVVGRGKFISDAFLTQEEKSEIKDYQFLTAKPKFLVLNVDEKSLEKLNLEEINFIPLNIKIEGEISELNPQEFTELGIASQLDQLILKCYHTLNLITFYTIAGGKETRAWTLQKGSRAQEAGGKVHSDFEQKFIRAEVIPWEKLTEAGAWSKARELGLLKTVGKEYVLEDGDVIEFKI